MIRHALAAAAGLVLAAAVGAPASAHGPDAPAATDYRTTVTGVSAGLDGVTVRAVEAGNRLELTNRGGEPVEVLGYAGEPFLEIRPDGVYENARSPMAGTDAADPTAPPQWQRISAEPVARWHDDRAHWTGADPPAQAAADPATTHRLRDWVVPLRRGVTAHRISGTLDWVPPPQPGAWWAAALLLAAGTAAAAHRAGRRRTWVVAPLALLGGLATLGYAAARQLDAGATGPGGVLLGLLGGGLGPALSGLTAAVLGVVLLIRRSGDDFVTAVVAACLAVFGGLTNSAVFGSGVVPAPGPAWWVRAAVAAAIGVGAGLTVAAIVRLRAPVRPAPA